MPRSSWTLDRIAVFVAVAQSGGFTAAALRLGTTKARVSQQISRLEADLGVGLFFRTTRKVELTQEGERLLAEAAPAVAHIGEAVAMVGTNRTRLRGAFRVTVGLDYLDPIFAPQLVAFGRLHPDLRIDVLATDAVVDLVGERVDLAIRRGWLRDSSLTATSLGKFDQYLVASPAYLRARPAIRRPEDLVAHACIALTRLHAPSTWHFVGPGGQKAVVEMAPVIACNAPLGVLALARAGAGIAALAANSVEADLRRRKLVRVLDAWRLPQGGIYAIYPAAKHVPAATRAFIDFLRAKDV